MATVTKNRCFSSNGQNYFILIPPFSNLHNRSKWAKVQISEKNPVIHIKKLIIMLM
jgi:hypothetical protein